MNIIHSYKDLLVWQRGVELVAEIYLVTGRFPREELFGLTSQMRRAAVAIPSNIAEGRSRGTRKDFVQFLRIAYGSGSELETQIEIARILPDTKNLDFTNASRLLNEIMRMLNVMIRKLNPKANAAKS